MRPKLTFFLIFMLMFGALGMAEGAKTLELTLGIDRAQIIQAGPIYWLGLFAFAAVSSSFLLFLTRKFLK